MDNLTNYLLAICSLLFTGNMFFLRMLYVDFKENMKQTEANSDQLGIHKEKIDALEKMHKEKTSSMQAHYDEKIKEIQKIIEKQEESLKYRIGEISTGVKSVQEDVKKFYAIDKDVALIKQVTDLIVKNGIKTFT